MNAAVAVERTIDASPEVLYSLVSDVTRMGEWSPETESCAWLGAANGPVVGARFRGRNRRGARRWSTVCTVTHADPGRAFGFDVHAGPFRIARWEYRFEPSAAGTRVVETWTDQRSRFMGVLGKIVSGVGDREAHNRSTMTGTLERLAAAVPSAGSTEG